MKGFFDMQLVVGGLAIALGVLLVMALASLIFSDDAKRKKKKKYCLVLAGATACVWLAALVVLAPKASAQAAGFFRRVPFPNSYFPTAYQPYQVYTNNGTNAGYSTPVTTIATNNTTIWSSSYFAPSNFPINSVYIGKDWLPGLPVTIEVGICAPNGTNSGTWSNAICFSSDGNYFTPSNFYWIGGTFGGGGSAGGGTTNWFYFSVPTTVYSNNMAYAAWDGFLVNQTGPVQVVQFNYIVPHPTF